MKQVSEKAREIFESIVLDEYDPPGQLDGVCFGNSELKAEVQSLLEWYRKADSFLEHPLGEELLHSEGGDFRSGDQLQHYRLKRLLGTGGFGFVFEAEQTVPVKRRVAVKVIKPGMDTEEVINRFRFELETLASMTHPNIARILDAGKDERGRPFFVMDLVDGCDIATYFRLNQHSTRKLLEVVVDVCRAVHYAHQKGVIHRDLKASNILVEEQNGVPVPRVIDFGIAKSIGGAGEVSPALTRSFLLLGTPLYMSPEQAEKNRDIDTRTDVYSLGAILYELLTGVTPLGAVIVDEADIETQRDLVIHRDPPRPSQQLKATLNCEGLSQTRKTGSSRLFRTVKGDLDWIIMKSLEKNRERRYASVDELANDLTRYLEGKPVNARPPSIGYRLEKLIRKNKVALGVFSLVLVVSALAIWHSVSLLNTAERERLNARRIIDTMLSIAEASQLSQDGQNVTAIEAIRDANLEQIGEISDPDTRAELALCLEKMFVDAGYFEECARFIETTNLNENEVGLEHRLKEKNFECRCLSAINPNGEPTRDLATEIIAIAEGAKGKIDEAVRLKAIMRAKFVLSCFVKSRDFDRAIGLLDEALLAAIECGEEEWIVRARRELATVRNKPLSTEKKILDARRLHEYALEHLGPDNIQTLRSQFHYLKSMRYTKPDIELVDQICTSLVPMMEEKLCFNHSDLYILHKECYSHYRSHPAYREVAVHHLLCAFEIAKQQKGMIPDSKIRARVGKTIDSLVFEGVRLDAALEAADDLVVETRDKFGADSKRVIQNLIRKAAVQRKLNKLEDALETLGLAKEWKPKNSGSVKEVLLMLRARLNFIIIHSQIGRHGEPGEPCRRLIDEIDSELNRIRKLSKNASYDDVVSELQNAKERFQEHRRSIEDDSSLPGGRSQRANVNDSKYMEMIEELFTQIEKH